MKRPFLTIAAVALLSFGLFSFTTKPKESIPVDPNQDSDPDPTPVDTVPVQTVVQTPVATVVLNADLLLKRGMQGYEVKELQRLLNVTADGIFGPMTENALYNRKGVRQITLNQFNKFANVVPTSLKVGDTVRSNMQPFAIAYKNIYKNGMYYNTGVQVMTFGYLVTIGKIVAMTADKTKCVVQINSITDPQVWIKTNQLAKV